MISNKDNAVYIEAVSKQEDGYAASGVIDLDALPADGNYITLDGTTFTFRDTPDVANDVQIGDDALESVTNLMSEALPTTATYEQNGTAITITYSTIGTAGNDYTIDCDYVGGLISTLSGGSDTPDTDWVKASGTTVGYTPKEINILPDTTNTAFKSNTIIAEGDSVILVNNDNSFAEVALGAVTTEELEAVANGSFTTNLDDYVIEVGDWAIESDTLRPNTDGDSNIYQTIIVTPTKETTVSADISWTDGNIFLEAYEDYIDVNNRGTKIGGGVYSDVTAISFNITPSKNEITIFIATNDTNDWTMDNLSVTYTKYTAEINQSEAPVKAFFNDSLDVAIALEATKERTFCQDIQLTKISSTTTQFVGENTKSGLLAAGDIVSLDGIEVESTNVVEEDAITINTLDILNDGSCIACYNLDGDATDLSGDYDGTETDVTYDTGKFGDCAVFNGDSSYIELNYDIRNKDSFTLSVWYNTYNLDNSRVVSFEDGGGSSIVIRANSVCIDNRDDEGDSVSIATIDNTDVWYNVVLTYNSNDDYNVYVNAVFVESIGNSIKITNTDDTPNIGKRGASADDLYFNGLIDQVRIFNKALTADEVSKLHNEEKYKYTIDFDEQAAAPTTCIVPDRSTQLDIVSKTFDGTKFTNIYSDLDKQGRAFQRKVTAAKSGTTVLEPLTTQMYKGA